VIPPIWRRRSSPRSTLTLAGKRGGRNLPPLTFDITGTSTLGELQPFFNQGMTLDSTVTPAAGTSLTPLATDPATVTRLRITGHVGKENALSLTGSAFQQLRETLRAWRSPTTSASNPRGEERLDELRRVRLARYAARTSTSQRCLEAKADTGNTVALLRRPARKTRMRWHSIPAARRAIPGAMLGTGTMPFDSDGKLIS
jgi:hypothetical protein